MRGPCRCHYDDDDDDDDEESPKDAEGDRKPLANAESTAQDAFKRHDPITYQQMSVIEFAEIIVANSLREWPREYTGSLSRQRLSSQRDVSGQQQLVRITDQDGDPNYSLTDRDRLLGKETGRNRDEACFMCRRYDCKYHMTTYCCRDCGTPLCHKDRTNVNGRSRSCKDEHWHSLNSQIKCNGRKKA